MKLALALVLLVCATAAALVCATDSALAAPPRCENATLITSIGKLRGSQALKVVRSGDEGQRFGPASEARLELVHGPSREVALRVTCDAIELPLADQVERPTKGSATRVIDGITLSRTVNGAVSFDFPADLLDPGSVQVLVLDDDSVSIVRGDKVYYAFATKSDGTVVETEGVGNGCGCERTTAPDGKTTTRRLPR